MPNVVVQLPAGIDEGVLIPAGAVVEQVAPVVACRVVRPRFLLGGALDGSFQVSLLVITDQSEELRLDEAEVTGRSPTHSATGR